MERSLTEEEVQQITDLSSLFFTPREIAIMMQLDPAAFVMAVSNESTKEYIAFYSGRLQSEVDLRRSIIKLAKSGSSPAQTMSMDMMKHSAAKMLDK